MPLFRLHPTLVLAAALTLASPLAAAERPDAVTIAIRGTYPSHVFVPPAKAPGAPATHALDVAIEVHGARVVTVAGAERFETRFDGSAATATAPARCNGAPTAAQRRTIARAWFADGTIIVSRGSETAFPPGGPCGGATASHNETFAIRLDGERCEFGYTAVTRRSGAGALDRTDTIVRQPCVAAFPGRAPQVARAPATGPAPAATATPAPAAADRARAALNRRLAHCILRGGRAEACAALLGIAAPGMKGRT